MFHRNPRPDARVSRLADEIQQRRTAVRSEIDKALDAEPAEASTGRLYRVFTSVSPGSAPSPGP